MIYTEVSDFLTRHDLSTVVANDQRGYSALHLAVLADRPEMLEPLLEAGADLESVDSSGLTPVALAVARVRPACFEILRARQPIMTGLTPQGFNLMHLAAQSGFTAVLPGLQSAGLMLDARDADGNTPLHLALAAGQEDTAQLLLQQGAATTSAVSGGVTPLHMASYGWAGGVLSNMLEVADAVNIQDELGYTPMDYAMGASNKPAGLLLRRAGGHMTMAARSVCAVCQGNGVCLTCRGYKQVRCPRCQGSGGGAQQNVREKCKRCNGAGTVSGIGASTLPCPACRGAGNVTAPRTAPCRNCAGRGSVVCPDCGGRGVCPRCESIDRQAVVDEHKRQAAVKIGAVMTRLRSQIMSASPEVAP